MFHHVGLCILFTIFSTTLLHAEKHSIYNGENKYIIRECVKSKSNQNELTRINNLILQGNYFAAESRIKKGSKNFTTPAEKAIAYMLQSTVAYNQSRYDVSLHLIEKSNSISVKKSKRIYFRNCNNKAKIFLTLGRHNSADSLLKLLIEKEKAANDIFNLGYSYHYLALIHHYLGHYEQAEEFFLLSIKYNNLSNDLKCKSSNLSFLGLNYCHLRNYSKGMLNLQESIRIREKYSDLRGLANSYLNLNKLYDAMGNQKKLLAAEFKSLSICKTIGDQQCVIGRYIEISNLHMRNNEFNKAEFYYRTALKKVKGLQLKDKLGLIYLGLATIEFNRSAYQQAQIYCDSSVQIFENWDKKDNLIELYLLKSKLYKVLNQTDSALSYAHLSFKMANDFRSSKNSMLACTELSELLEKKGEFNKALNYFKLASKYASTVSTTEKSKWLMEKEIQFSLEKKQEAVLQKQRQKEMMAIERTEAQRKVSFALAIGLILVVGLLIYSIYLYRQRNASQKSLLNLTEQNAEMSRKMAEQEVFALIGEVSASVAHDLNTPLGAIKAGTENINAVLITIVNELIGKCSEAQFRRSLELAAQRPLELFIGGLQIRKESNLMYEYLLADKAHLLSDSDAKEMAVQLTQARIGLSDVALIHEILEATNSKDFIRLIIQAQNLVSFLGTVTDSAERAYEVVQNIREQIQGSSHLEMNKVNLKENIEDVVKTFNHFFKSDYSLRLNVEDSVYILGDSVKLYQLWSNLLKNAIEASPKNETIEIFSTQMDGVVSVHITNKGERIPEDVISKIFDRFYTTKKAKNGTGLGLAIVKKVAEIHNAKMDVQSTEEKTEFIISLKIVV